MVTQVKSDSGHGSPPRDSRISVVDAFGDSVDVVVEGGTVAPTEVVAGSVVVLGPGVAVQAARITDKRRIVRLFTVAS